FTKNALAKGAKIKFETRVTSIETRSRKVVAVETNKGRIECEKVVICTGARARELARTVGVDLPVEPQKRQIVWAKSAKSLPDKLPMVIDIGSGFHFRPARDFTSSEPVGNDEILFAYPDPDEQTSFDTNFKESFVGKVYEKAKHRSPFLYRTTPILEKCRAGLYENTPDHHAILGGCNIEGLYFANGFSGHGVMHSPATGRALAEIMLDGAASFLDVSCLSLARFAKGELLYETAFI
ncbi:MAG: FAD-binding oxidoreductase, partial [Pyrinomonadaceae bacterium]|nr:FAD-binding oxidoreductase [Pyrinomonadaceae bacterium]